MGGHAPIVGAELYVFQAGQTGYASAPLNEMNSDAQGTDPTHVLTGLFGLQGSSATPFQPNLAATPNDFGIAIVYNNTLNTHVGAAESVAIESDGQIWTTAQKDKSTTL